MNYKKIVLILLFLILVFFVGKNLLYKDANSEPYHEIWRINLKEIITKNPVVDGEFVYVQTFTQLFKINKDGNVVWKQEIKTNRSFVSPVVSQNLLIVVDNIGAIYAFDKNNGSLIWRHAEKNFTGESTVTVDQVSVFGDSVYVVYFSLNIKAFDLKTGSEKWLISVPGRSSPDMDVNEDYIVFDTYNDDAINFHDPKTGEFIKKEPYEEKYVVRDLIVNEDSLLILFKDYSNNWKLTAYDLNTYEETFNKYLESDQFKCLTTHNGELYVFGESSYKINFETNEILWKNEIVLETCPVFVNEKILLSKNDFGRGVIIDRRTGKLIEKLSYPVFPLNFLIIDKVNAVKFQENVLFPYHSKLVLLDLNN